MKIAEVRKLALGLPEVTEQAHFHMTSFRVAGIILATVPPGDGYLHLMEDEQHREQMLMLHPTVCENCGGAKRSKD